MPEVLNSVVGVEDVKWIAMERGCLAIIGPYIF